MEESPKKGTRRLVRRSPAAGAGAGSSATGAAASVAASAAASASAAAAANNMSVPPHFRDSNVWEDPPESEVERLQTSLYPHLRKIGLVVSKAERIAFVEKLFEKQNNTCAFGKSVGGMYCWNEPRDGEKRYLKLQWGHIKPRCRKNDTQTIGDLCLLCARCNNQIQTSRYLCQLKAELESKLENIDELMKS